MATSVGWDKDHFLGAWSCHTQCMLGFPLASLPSPLTSGFSGKERTHVSPQKKPIIFTKHNTFFLIFFFHTRRNYLVQKQQEENLENSLITNCSQVSAAEGYQESFSSNNFLRNLGWISLKYLSFQTPNINKQKY